MGKFLRNYVLNIETQKKESLVTVKPPITIDFDVTRNVYRSANNFSVKIHNLAPDRRDSILKDYWDFDMSRVIGLNAGYGSSDKLPQILRGNIKSAWSSKEGTSVVTNITGVDALSVYSDAIINEEFPAGTEYRDVVRTLIKYLGQFGVSQGAIGDLPGKLPRANSYSGKAIDVLQQVTGGGLFIDNGVAHVLKDNEFIKPGDAVIIRADSGLLGTPKREETLMSFEMVFEPKIAPGMLIHVESSTGQLTNGYGIAKSVHHKGTISDGVGGTATTTVTVFYGPGGLKEVPIG